MTASININLSPTPLLYSAAQNLVPINALLDENGQAILDENGAYILTE